MAENIRWLRKVRPGPIPRIIPANTSIPVSMPDEWVQHEGPPLYRNGRFIVIDPIEDTEFCVIDTTDMRTVKTVRLDFVEAMRWCDTFAEAASDD